jgi:hypothetical protein
MGWGHRLERLTKRDRDLYRTLGWGCCGCDEGVGYVSYYSCSSELGHAAAVRRPLCETHARDFAQRYGLLAQAPFRRAA